NGGKVKAAGNAFHGTRQQHGVTHIADQQFGTGGEVFSPAGGQIVQYPHALSRRDKGGAKVRTDETTATGNQPKRHAGRLRPASTWPNNSAWPRVVSSQSKRSAWARVARRAGGLASSRRSAVAIGPGPTSSSTSPASGAEMASRLPQAGPATTGVPQAIASSITFAQPSRVEASTSASAAPYSFASSACGRAPSIWTRSATPSRSASAARA